jgi:hypothetical protein
LHTRSHDRETASGFDVSAFAAFADHEAAFAWEFQLCGFQPILGAVDYIGFECALGWDFKVEAGGNDQDSDQVALLNSPNTSLSGPVDVLPSPPMIEP